MYRGILAALGLINFGFGILSAAQPLLVAGWIGFELTSPSAFGEMRAVFGGAVAVVGVLFVVAILIPRPAPLLGGLCLVFAALSAGRASSLAIDGWSAYTALALLLEAATAAILLLLWRKPELLRPELDLEAPSPAVEALPPTPSPPDVAPDGPTKDASEATVPGSSDSDPDESDPEPS